MSSRRAFLLVASAAVAACASPAVGPPPAAGRRPFRFIDATGAFFTFWERAEHEPVDAQIQRFRDEVVAAYPSVYAPNVLGLRGEDAAAALKQRLAAWLPTLPALVPRMRAVHARFEADMDRGVASMRAAAPSFGWDGTCYLFASIDSMNGGMRDVDGRAALLFGVDVMAKPGTSMPPPVLFAHELFHAHQSRVLPPDHGDKRVYQALWTEGLATYASMVVVPGAINREALPMSHLHDPANASLDIPARRVVLADAMPRYAKALGAALLAAFDSTEEADYATFFLGRAAPRLGERPVRSGYWFGLQVARALAGGRPLDVLSRLPAASLQGDIRAALAAVVARAA